MSLDNKLWLRFIPGDLQATLVIRSGKDNATTTETKRMTGDDLVELAGLMVACAAIIGTSPSAFTVAIENLRANFTNAVAAMEATVTPTHVISTGEQCSYCGKVIQNAANMSRHLVAHMKTDPEEKP